MEDQISFNSHAKALLLLFLACAFFAVFATVDTSEHYRAWRTARKWTDEQKLAAPAQDADSMYSLILAALAAETSIIAISFIGALGLGIATSTESAKTYALARAFGWLSAGLGLVYAILMVYYQIRVGPRVVLKGPIFDYDLSMQIPILLAVIGYPATMAVYALFLYRKRVDRKDQP